jgi:uncharacterized integral membrane protein
MGEKLVFQPLTREDKVTVVLYRTGIVLSASCIAVLAYLLAAAGSNPGNVTTGRLPADILVFCLYISTGMSVYFIHLYVSKFHKFLKNLYIVSLVCLAWLLFIGKGSPTAALAHAQHSPLLLLPLSGCLGFVTAKEAFCFRLFEGYILAMIMPFYLLLVSGSFLAYHGVLAGLVLIAAILVVFTLRKVFMPIAYDIGDKSAYQ